MAIRSRVTQDRRKISRIATRLECRFEFEAKSYKAVIIDLSIKGAYFSSAFLPPFASRIEITVVTPHLPKPLTLQGVVLRGSSGMSDHGAVERFGVEFRSAPLDLTKLIGKLIAQ